MPWRTVATSAPPWLMEGHDALRSCGSEETAKEDGNQQRLREWALPLLRRNTVTANVSAHTRALRGGRGACVCVRRAGCGCGRRWHGGDVMFSLSSQGVFAGGFDANLSSNL